MTIPFCSCSCVASVVISLVVVAMSSYSASTGNLGICVEATNFNCHSGDAVGIVF